MADKFLGSHPKNEPMLGSHPKDEPMLGSHDSTEPMLGDTSDAAMYSAYRLATTESDYYDKQAEDESAKRYTPQVGRADKHSSNVVHK